MELTSKKKKKDLRKHIRVETDAICFMIPQTFFFFFKLICIGNYMLLSVIWERESGI